MLAHILCIAYIMASQIGKKLLIHLLILLIHLLMLLIYLLILLIHLVISLICGISNLTKWISDIKLIIELIIELTSNIEEMLWNSFLAVIHL